MKIQNYKDLIVWQKSRELVKNVYIIAEKLPKHEQFGLNAQIRRCAVSVPSNIAEGHSRNSIKEYIHFLYIAFGSLAELETQLILACDIGYFSETELNTIFQQIAEIQRMITGLRKSLSPKT